MKAVCLLLALLVAAAGAHASATKGSVGFATPLLTTADASPTGNINTSNLFSLEFLVTTGNDSGLFNGIKVQNFGTVSFDTTMATSLHVSDTEFGSFQSAKLQIVTNISGFLNLLFDGTWTPGTFNSGLHGSFPARFRASFTQTPQNTGEISFSGTMSTIVPVSTVPEPPASLLFLSGIGLVVVGSRLRQRCV